MSLNDNIKFLKETEKKLKAGGVKSAEAEAEQLVEHFAGASRLEFFTGRKSLFPKTRVVITAAIKQRVKGIPLQHLLKTAPFFGHEFFVSPAVLIPRPETELLAEEAIRVLEVFYPPTQKKAPADKSFLKDKRRKRASIMDLGTGSGCLAVSLTIARPDCRMTALDVSLKALEVARRNIGFYRLRERIRLVKSDLFSSVKWGKTGLFDVIVSNPPYIPEKDLAGLPREVQFDPRLALNGGLRGLEIIDRILKDAPTFLKKDGWLLMEIGEKQAARVKKTALQTNNFKNIRFVKDLNGVERVFVGQRI